MRSIIFRFFAALGLLALAVISPQTGQGAAARGGKAIVYGAGGRVTLQNDKVRITFDLKKGTYNAWRLPEQELFICNAYAQIGPTPFTPAPLTSAEPLSITTTTANTAVATTTSTPTAAASIQAAARPTPAAAPPLRPLTTLTGCRFTWTWSEFDDRLGAGRTLRLRGRRTPGPDVLIEFALHDRQGFFTVAAGVINTTTQTLRLREFYPLRADFAHGGGVLVGPDPARDHRVLTGEGDTWCPRLLGEVSAKSANVALVTWLRAPEKRSFVLGGLTTFEFLHRVSLNYKPGAHITQQDRAGIDAWIRTWDPAGKRVEPGKAYLPDPALVDFTRPNPYDALEHYARTVAQAMNVKLAGTGGMIPVCLWYLSSTSIGDNNTAGALREARLMHDMGLADYAPPLVRLIPDVPGSLNGQLWWDDEHWRRTGHLVAPADTISKWTAALQKDGAAGELGLQPAVPSSDYAANNPGHMLFNDPRKLPDTTDPAFAQHLRTTFRRLKDEGVKGFFFDYCGLLLLGGEGGFDDPAATAVSSYRRLFTLAKEAVGPQFPITENPNGRATVGAEAATGVADAKRSESDKVNLSSQVIRRGIREWYRNRVTKLIDPDVKNFEPFDGDLLHAQVTAMATMFGKTMLGSSVTRYTPEAIHALGRTLPMPPDAATARPIGLFNVPDEGDFAPNPEVYEYPLGADSHLLLFWNYGGRRTKVIEARLGGDTAFGGTGLDEKLTYDLWDTWDWEDRGSLAGGSILSAPVRAGEMKTFVVHPAERTPYVLATTRHIIPAMGAADVRWTAASKTLRGTFHVIGRDPFRAIIKLPASGLWTVADCQLTGPGAGAAKLVCHTDLMAKTVELAIASDATRDIAWSIRFEVKKADKPVTPGIPPGLGVELVAAAGCAQLKWDESDREADRAVRYLVYRGDRPDFAPAPQNRIGVAFKPTLSDDDIRSGVVYYYKVVAEDASGARSKPAAVSLKVPVTFSRAILNQIDESTAGNWKGKYGADGYLLFSVVGGNRDKVQLPSYVESLSYRGHKGTYLCAMSSTDPRALAYSDDTTKTRRLGALAAFQDLYLEMKVTDTNPHAFGLYFVNWEGLDRRFTVEVLDQATRRPLAAPYELEKFRDGKYLQYVFRGSVIVKISRPETSNGVVLSGIFFDEPKLKAPAPFKAYRPIVAPGGEVLFAWQLAPGAVAYRLTIGEGADLDHPVYNDTGWETSRQVHGLMPGKAYTWQVEAVGGKGSATFEGGLQHCTIEPAAAFLGVDDWALGNWRARHGKAGYVLLAGNVSDWSDEKKLPDFIESVETLGSQYYSWLNLGKRESPAAPEPPPGGVRCGSAIYDHWYLTVDIKAKDSAEHTVSLYNWLGSIYPPDGMDAWVEVLDPESGQILDRRYDRRMLDEVEGRYFTYRFKERLLLRLRNVNGPYCFLNGIFWEN